MENFPQNRRNTRQRYLIAILAFGLIVSAGFLIIGKALRNQKEDVPAAVNFASVTQQENNTLEEKSASPEVAAAKKTETTSKTTVPTELNLAVPFYSQAPFSNWDYPWQEACEEASVLLVANTYFDYQWDRSQFNKQILDLVAWEKDRFGDYKHTSVQETADMMEEYLNLKSIIHEDPSFADVQKVLANGHLIVMTFDGKTLGNPNYKNGGPVYHAMVIKGYKEAEKIITNDVGTRNGENYVYNWSTIQNSLHDYSEPMKNGAKRMIEVLPPAPPTTASATSAASTASPGQSPQAQ